MPVTATLSLASPVEDEPRAELDNLVSARFSPSDVLNAITSVTATFDGGAVTVTTVAVASGIKDCSFPATFVIEATHTVVWTCTTADANANIFTYSFTSREADWGTEHSSLVIGESAWYPESVDLIVEERTGGSPEFAELVVVASDTSWAEVVELAVLEGLGAGYYSLERVELIVGRLEEIDMAMCLSIEVGTLGEASIPLSLSVESEQTHNWLPGSLEVYSEEATDGLRLSLEVSLEGANDLKLSLETGDPSESTWPLSMEIEQALMLPIPLEIRLVNEDLAAAEESMSGSEADA